MIAAHGNLSLLVATCTRFTIGRQEHMRSLATFLIVSGLAAAPASAMAQDSSAGRLSEAVQNCVTGLGSGWLAARIPVFVEPSFREEVCKCAKGPASLNTPSSGSKDDSPDAVMARAAGRVLACAGQALAATPPASLEARELVGALAYAGASGAEASSSQLAKITFGTRQCPKPEYPAPARRAEAEGRTTVAFLVDEEGRAQDVVVIRSAGLTQAHKLLDYHIAIQGLACKFEPALKGGKAVAGWTYVTFAWRLQ